MEVREPFIMAGKTSCVSAVFAVIMEGAYPQTKKLQAPLSLERERGVGGIGLKQKIGWKIKEELFYERVFSPLEFLVFIIHSII